MENILKIIYDKTVINEIIDSKDIEKILELLVIDKHLNDYILNINFQHIRSNNLASYSTYTKSITVYTEQIKYMIRNIENNTLNVSLFEMVLYKNLSILQIILHEVEHANQQKIAYHENSLEALIIRLSLLVKNGYDGRLYEYCPEERLAEIKSFEQIINLIGYLNNNLLVLSEILGTEKLKRLLRGYHYKNSYITVPIVDYFIMSKKTEFLSNFNFNTNMDEQFSLEERFKYGFPISIDEYSVSMKKLILSLNKNFNNRIDID